MFLMITKIIVMPVHVCGALGTQTPFLRDEFGFSQEARRKATQLQKLRPNGVCFGVCLYDLLTVTWLEHGWKASCALDELQPIEKPGASWVAHSRSHGRARW